MKFAEALFKYLLVGSLIVLLTGCGFHLRGTTQFAPPLQRIYIKTATPYAELTRDLRNYLIMSGVQIVDSEQQAETVLVIISEQQSQQLLGVDSAQQTRQYNLTLTVNFQLTDKHDAPLTEINTLSQTRTLPINSAEVVTSSSQAAALYQQMRREIVFAMMNRISSQEITHQLTKKPMT